MNDMTTKRDQQWCRALVEVSGTLASCLVHVDGRRVVPSDILGPVVSRFNEIRCDDDDDIVLLEMLRRLVTDGRRVACEWSGDLRKSYADLRTDVRSYGSRLGISPAAVEKILAEVLDDFDLPDPESHDERASGS